MATLKIAIDTNMLLAMIEKKIDFFGQAKQFFGSKIVFAVPEKVYDELEKFGKKGKKMELKIELVKSIMEKNRVKKIRAEGDNADACLENLASKGYIIATNDKALRKKIKAFGNPIYLKQNRLIALG